MTVPMVLLPVFIQIFLTFAILGVLGRARFGAAAKGEIKMGEIAVDETAWSPDVRKISNSFKNQFEMPVLFYVLVALNILTHTTNVFFVAMEWVFVLSRVAHAYIHCTSNYIPHRFRAYGVGLFTLAAMWIIYAVRVLAGF